MTDNWNPPNRDLVNFKLSEKDNKTDTEKLNETLGNLYVRRTVDGYLKDLLSCNEIDIDKKDYGSGG